MSGTVLVLRALGVGDLLTAVPALRALRKEFDGRRIVLAAPEPLRGLVDLVEAVDRLHPTPGLGGLEWRAAPPSVAVNLHGEGPESLRELLGAGPSALISHRNPAVPNVPGAPWRPELHEVDRWCRLLEEYGIPADPTDLALPPPPGPVPHRGAVVVHPGAAAPARRWPAERFALVARHLRDDGHDVVITGGPAETGLARSVAEAAGVEPERVLAGRTGLGELAATVAAARLLLSGDTGVAHLATAFGTPSAVLFGPTPPALWGPPPGRPHHVAMWAGRTGDPLGDRPDPGLLELESEAVLERCRELIRRHGP
ncbi:glycosyltransferase family 9 protein [Glycomyces tenuis]|uniref:glycosyltransferase family 9 protein n=1 Tax=Glycomyces tenuis TaxID=58116 RepID=UPI0004116481|nr:glycosyltransferase family 9 protein [Glycomyces tenuis]